jgi:hypothetical protein
MLSRITFSVEDQESLLWLWRVEGGRLHTLLCGLELYSVLYYGIVYFSVLYRIVLYCTVLYYVLFYYSVL